MFAQRRKTIGSMVGPTQYLYDLYFCAIVLAGARYTTGDWLLKGLRLRNKVSDHIRAPGLRRASRTSRRAVRLFGRTALHLAAQYGKAGIVRDGRRGGGER